MKHATQWLPAGLLTFVLLACGSFSSNPAHVFPVGDPGHIASERASLIGDMPTPAPVIPAPVPVAAPPSSVPDMIRVAFAPLGGAAVSWALRIANCESGYNPNAVNPSGDATGVFQFLRSTWAGTPYAGYSRTDAWANVQAGAWLYARQGPTPWMCK